MTEEIELSENKEEKNVIVGGTLYLVATPIGNLSDISFRACKVLREVDFIAAEDTRNCGKLLRCLEIPPRPVVSYHQHNAKMRGEQILARLLGGESCALVTDAGTPAISDPGELLVRLCAEHGVPVTSVPGACAAVNALALSALSSRRFLFEGFLEGNHNEHLRHLQSLQQQTQTLIFYASPHHLKATLQEMLEVFGDRPVALCRELTKRNEEILHTSLGQAVEMYQEKEPRGEYVLVVGGCPQEERKTEPEESVEAQLERLLAEGMTKNEAVKAIAKSRGGPKGEIYRLVMIK